MLIELLVLLTAALIAGTVAEQLRQSAIVGYLLVGAVLGKNALGWVSSNATVDIVSELGVALLLFTIGLEFSIRDLRRLGMLTLISGTFQIALTIAAVMGVAMLAGLGGPAAFALGSMVALSSTASVLRLLHDRAEAETPYGRKVTGILLLQDAAVLPLTLIIAAMAGGGGWVKMGMALGRAMLFGTLMIGAFIIVFNYAVPRMLNLRRWVANRELPVLLAFVMAAGAATAAHAVSISPAMGAFLAGVLLASSPFAVQIRADVGPIRTVLVTLFFISVGMVSDPGWAMQNALQVAVAVIVVVLGKTVIVWMIGVALRIPSGMALAAGLCLGQVGEFSFVLAKIAGEPTASGARLIEGDMMKLAIAATVVSLLLTPYLVMAAPASARWVGWLTSWRSARPGLGGESPGAASVSGDANETPGEDHARVLIVGFGPAGQRVAEALLAEHSRRILVLDLNPRAAAVAHGYGLKLHVGNAGQNEVLEAAGIRQACAVVVTVPDPAAARQVILLCRQMNPAAKILVRARYHAYRWELVSAGAEIVIDEEEQVGRRLSAEVRRILSARAREARALASQNSGATALT